jgi:hypothetical protein
MKDKGGVVDIINAILGSWPLAVVLLGFTALLLFRKPLLQLLNRADEFGVAGLKVSARSQVQPHDNQSTISQVEQLATAMQSPMLTEQENFILNNLDSLTTDHKEREKMLIKLLAASQISVAFERTYIYIFGSQIAMLQALNSIPGGFESMSALRPFYEQAKAKHPDFYGSYSFENWLSFLQTQLLILEQDEKIGITVRGKEFLKYMIQQNYSFNKNG